MRFGVSRVFQHLPFGPFQNAVLVIERLRVRVPAEAAGELSRVNFVCRLLFGVRSIPVLPRWHVKDPAHSANSVGGRLHLNTHTPLIQRSRSGLTMLSRLSVGTYHSIRATTAHATRQETLGHGPISSLSHCGLTMA